jgi:hypothetical protein
MRMEGRERGREKERERERERERKEYKKVKNVCIHPTSISFFTHISVTSKSCMFLCISCAFLN